MTSFTCPVCLEIPQEQIYQCKFGHIVCHSCASNLRACPQCRVAYESPKIRNLALEEMMDKQTFECQYQSEGCRVKVKRGELSSHAEICTFGENVLRFCELLGYSCDFSTSIKRVPTFVNHFLECHHIAICHDANIELRLEGVSDFKENRRSMWYPVVIDLERQNGASFLLLTLHNQEDKTISIICLQLHDAMMRDSQSHTSNDSRIEFFIQTAKPQEAADLMWSVMPIPFKHAALAIRNKLFRFPVDLLKNLYTKDGTVILCCSIGKDKTDASSRLNPATLCTFNVPLTTRIPKPKETTGTTIVYNTKELKFGCDNCDKVASSLPYRCLQCVKFHVCEDCMESGAHGQHIFAKFRNLNHEYEVGKKLKWKWGSFFPSPMTLNGSNQTVAKCVECKEPSPNMFLCMQCKPGFGYCSKCFGSYKRDHDRDHFFAVVKTEKRVRLVLENHPMRQGS